MAIPFLLYGSYGYTGSLIADLAVRRGLRPVLSGRDIKRLRDQATALGLEYLQISLDDRSVLDSALSEVPLVLNCAGPFSQTYQPLVDACLRKGGHYLDITGEITVFEALVALDKNARDAGVMLLPGVGLDVVPSDCLAAHLKQRLPDANQLALAITMWGGSSRGTLLTGIEGLSLMGTVRRDGKLVQAESRINTRQVDFGRGLRTVLSIPWGDISTAFHSTSIPNINTYMAFPESMVQVARILSPLMRSGKNRIIQRLLRWAVMRMPDGPSEEVLHRGGTRIWGEVTNHQGQVARALLETPEGHILTAEAAIAIVSRILDGSIKPGFQTPSLVFGADFILDFKDVHRQDL